MSQQFGPKIRTDNLVLCLDAYDYKSYQGEPTTNLLSNGDFENNSTSGWSFDPKTDGSWSVISSDKKHGSYCAKLINSTVNTIALWQGFSMNTGETYTVSCWIKNVNCPTTPFFNVTNATFDENSLTTITTGVTAGSEWTYVSKTFTTNATGTCNPYIRTSSNSLQGHFLIDDFQVEQKGYATPFVNGTRSTTSTWKDRTNNANDGDFVSTTGTKTTHYRNKNLIYPPQNAYIDFNGTTEYVNINHDNSLDITGNMTLETWVYLDSAMDGNLGMIAVKRDNSDFTSPFQLSFEDRASQNRYGVVLGEGSSYCIATSNDNFNGVYNKWDHVVAVIDGLSVNLYVNGVLGGNDTFSGTRQTNTRPIRLGNSYSYGGVTYPLYGKIGMFRMYSRALSANEVLKNYRTTKGRYGL